MFCAACSTKHPNNLMFVVMICTLMALTAQIINETDEIKRQKITAQNIFAAQAMI